MSVARKIAILGTGGTIAGQGSTMGSNVGYQAGQIGVAQLLQPVLLGLHSEGWECCTQQVAQLDSKDMDIEVWQQLAQACLQWLAREEVAALVITHGTDTLEETAWFLQQVLQPGKPVIMTCAMRPATALSADGPANLRDAVQLAAQAPAGVWVVAAGEVHSAQQVRKVHPYRLHAFSGAGAGPAGWIEEGQLRWANGQPQQPHAMPLPEAVWMQPAAQWPWVELVTSTAAARSQGVDALVAAGVQGLVVAATGNGSVHETLRQALLRARAAGVCVWRTTRCEQGSIVLAQGQHDPNVSPLSPVKARISMMLHLLARSVQA